MKDTFIRSITGGALIGLGGTCFLSIENKIIGAVLFSLGLLAICVTGQFLFTGKASYNMDFKFLLTILLGNTIGACALGSLISFLKPGLIPRATEMVHNKLHNESSLLLLGLLCNILIYFAVEGYNRGHAELLVMCVAAFILCGFEHSIANMYYFSVAREYSIEALLYLIVNVIGNWCGGILVQFFTAIIKEKRKAHNQYGRH